MNVFSVRMRNEKLKRATNKISDLEKPKNERNRVSVARKRAAEYTSNVYKQSRWYNSRFLRVGLAIGYCLVVFFPPYNVTVGP